MVHYVERGDSMFLRRNKFCNICKPLPGTIFRAFVAPGSAINILNLVEVASPSGICLIVRLPFLGGCAKQLIRD